MMVKMSSTEYDNFESALATIIANRISQLSFVKSFRDEMLGGELMSPDETVFWLLMRAVEPGEEEDEFEYFIPDVGGFGSDFAKIEEGSALHELYRVAVELNRICPVFEKPDLVELILTGVPPRLHRMLSIREEKARENMPATISRIQLIVDPLVSSKELEEFYAEERRKIWNVEKSSSKRNKPMSPTHLTMAVFLEINGEKMSGDELREKWNREYPDWKYEDQNKARNFVRDARAAWERVTGDRFNTNLFDRYVSSAIVWSALGRKANRHVADLQGVGWRAYGPIDDDGNIETKKGELPDAHISDVADYLLDSNNIELTLSPLKTPVDTKNHIRVETLASINGDPYVVRAYLSRPTARRKHMVIASWDVTPVDRGVVPAPQTTIRKIEALLPGVIMEHPELRDTPIAWR